MNVDILTEIFLRLPTMSLLRFKAVCKLWRDIIDSPLFRNLYTRNCNHNDRLDNIVQLKFSAYDRRVRVKINSKSLVAHRPIYGVICICTEQMVPIAICHLFLEQLKLLPPSTYPDSCRISCSDVATCFDGEDFKVVQLMPCWEHNRLHARLYSTKMDCWRELAGDGVVDDAAYDSVIPIKSFCENTHFAYWRVNSRKHKVGGDIVSRIVSFDVKNEVFRAIRLPPDYVSDYVSTKIFAKDEHSFRRFDSSAFSYDKCVKIYESRCEGSELSWHHMMNVEADTYNIVRYYPWWLTPGCVILEFYGSVFVYDYRDHKFIWKLSGYHKRLQSFDYGSTLVSHATFCDYCSSQFEKAIYNVDMLLA
ncbi:hypothetical protein AAHA92_03559 [Salvia divinorum]|uniref:F-box domain-containing protein n=1 Tax=Salvia divinorum TaxID=28513 RepID=A0ABD1IK19_SALDI